MAGLGFKNFQAGTVLTAADINGYLMRQSVMRFATAAARNTALGAQVSVGMTSYREDDAVIEVYDGTQWKPVGRDEPDQNFLINGNFDIYQRAGGGINLAPGYIVDRWATTSDKANLSWQRDDGIIGGTKGAPPAGSRFYISIQDSGSFANGKHGLEQALELDNVNRLWGKFVTFSVLLRASSAFNSRLKVSIQKNATANSRTGGTWSDISSTTIAVADIPKGTTAALWKRFSVTAFVPADGTANGLKVAVEMLDTTGLNNSFHIAQPQLEIGVTPSGFKLSQGTVEGERAACQRYYYGIDADGVNSRFGVGHNTTTTVAHVLTTFPTTMRVAPTSIETKFNASDYSIAHANTTTNLSTQPAFNTANRTSALSTLTVASGLTAGQGCAGRFTATDAFLGWSAELP